MKLRSYIVRLLSPGWLSLWLLAIALSPPRLAAQDITVSQAIPDNAPQGTVNLNVTIKGKGFKQGAVAKFFITQTNEPGGVKVNSTTFVSSGELTANIDVAGNAAPTKFDIVVQTSNGRTGKGIELFQVTVPDPAIAYTHGGIDSENDLMVMDDDGMNPTLVLAGDSNTGHHRPSWSPTGDQLVFMSNIGASNGVYIINKDGTGLCKVVSMNDTGSLIHGQAAVWSPAPAPDGRFKIAYADHNPATGHKDIFVVDAQCPGGDPVNLTSSGDRGEYFPTWDPYATRLAAQALQADTFLGVFVYQLGVDAANKVMITGSQNVTAAGPLAVGFARDVRWAKVSEQLAVSGRLSGEDQLDIWVIDLADTSNPQRVTTTSSTEYFPSWSPDDTKIVYFRTASAKPGKERAGIYVMNSDGSGTAQISGSGWETDWRRCCPTCATMCAP